jgi:hypothetical protein
MRAVQKFLFLPVLLAPVFAGAQTPPPISTEQAVQIVMQPQPPADTSALQNISITAAFDPPVARAGEKVFFRVSVGAIEHTIAWPEKISAPDGLQFGEFAHGQMIQPDGTQFHPLTAFLCEATAARAGRFLSPEFSIRVGESTIVVPAAALEVVEAISATTIPARRLALEFSDTNLFTGQPFRIRVILPADGKPAEALRDVQFNGGAFIADKRATRMSIGPVNLDGRLQPAFIYETVLTPMTAGNTRLSAQAFTTPPFTAGPITITSGGMPITLGGVGNFMPVFLVSDAATLQVRPLPAENELPGFTGALGKFTADKPLLSTNRIHVGEPLHLKLNFHGEGELSRFVPPREPRSREWQIIADKPPACGFTFIPQTDAATATPAVPFCTFDTARGKYYDLSIPPLPVTVVGDGLPTILPVDENAAESPAKLSGLATTAGKTADSLKPLQLRGWFVGVQLLPVAGFLALWQWDRRRRFWEAYPDLFRRRQARRALRKEKILLQKAAANGDAENFLRHAVNAMQIAAAPHFPAEPRALVCADVLAVIVENEPSAKLVRNIFAAADSQFSTAPSRRVDWPALKLEVEAALQKLEEKL